MEACRRATAMHGVTVASRHGATKACDGSRATDMHVGLFVRLLLLAASLYRAVAAACPSTSFLYFLASSFCPMPPLSTVRLFSSYSP